jgi:hypothetical protein
MLVEFFSKIPTVSMAVNRRWIDELGILHAEKACYILECFGVAQTRLVGRPPTILAGLILERVVLMAGLEKL